MRFSRRQFILIIVATILLTLAILRFALGGLGNYWTYTVAVPLIILAIIGLYGAYKLDDLALLIFFIGMVVILILDIVNLIVVLSNYRWKFHGYNFMVVVEICLLLIGAIVAHLLRTNGKFVIRL